MVIARRFPSFPPFSQLVGAVWDLPVAHPVPTSRGQIQAQNLSQPVLESLTYISTVGCSISAAATFCTLLLCCFFR